MKDAAETRTVRFSAHALAEADADGVAPDHVSGVSPPEGGKKVIP
jgi:hypothetical protein